MLLDGRVIGMTGGFQRDGEPEVTYWVGQGYWGRGLATRALSLFLRRFEKRPLFARVAKDNAASIRVCSRSAASCRGGEEKGFANARGEEVEEVIYRLE